MTTRIETEALLDAIERRLTEISERQHALAAERARLLDQMTPLRLGATSPAIALVQLRSKGIALPGLASAPSAGRRSRGVVLRVASQGARVVSLPSPHPETA